MAVTPRLVRVVIWWSILLKYSGNLVYSSKYQRHCCRDKFINDVRYSSLNRKLNIQNLIWSELHFRRYWCRYTLLSTVVSPCQLSCSSSRPRLVHIVGNDTDRPQKSQVWISFYAETFFLISHGQGVLRKLKLLGLTLFNGLARTWLPKCFIGI